jgi:TonB family protein
MEGIPDSDSLGLGRGGGAGTGRGTGIGSGDGSGLGPGFGGGTGGGVYRPGNGVETPRLLREVKPQYTAQAMRAKIQGEVLLECVVQADGTIGKISVVRSLDSTFGLDQEAIKAARQWRFAPGTRFGQPVNVLVTIQIAFTLR